MTAFGKPFQLSDLPERLQQQIREGATPRLAADPTPARPTTPSGAPKPPRARQGPKKAKGPNKTELRYLRENVEPLGETGHYEGITFRLANGHRYAPDWVYVDQTCSASCDKCGGTDIYRRHHRKGDKWDKMMGDYRRWETAHVAYDTYSCVARHECLTHHCRTCGYEWTTDIHKPNPSIDSRQAGLQTKEAR